MISSEILDIFELVYYVPLLPLAIYIAYKHGFSRESGWVLLNILALCRIVGGATGIAAVYKPSSGLIEASLITSTMGSATLLGTLTGLINRVNNGAGRHALFPTAARFLQLMTIAAIVLAINGGVQIGSGNTSLGYTLTKVALILFMVQFAATLAVTVHSWMAFRYIRAEDHKLLTLASASMPFVLVRLIYSLCAVFDHTSSDFSMLSTTTKAVIIRAFMDFAMEVIAASLIVVAGFVTPALPKGNVAISEVKREQDGSSTECIVPPPTYQQRETV